MRSLTVPRCGPYRPLPLPLLLLLLLHDEPRLRTHIHTYIYRYMYTGCWPLYITRKDTASFHECYRHRYIALRKLFRAGRTMPFFLLTGFCVLRCKTRQVIRASKLSKMQYGIKRFSVQGRGKAECLFVVSIGRQLVTKLPRNKSVIIPI